MLRPWCKGAMDILESPCLVTHSRVLLCDDGQVHLQSNHNLSCFNEVYLLGPSGYGKKKKKTLTQLLLINPWLAAKCLWASCWGIRFPYSCPLGLSL